ncbi:MAG: hypothetical protein SH859_14775, partial [Hyphomicrobium aestuarii]|nr:hypothetical protein [Hyphomicrobium aestuarii]
PTDASCATEPANEPTEQRVVKISTAGEAAGKAGGGTVCGKYQGTGADSGQRDTADDDEPHYDFLLVFLNPVDRVTSDIDCCIPNIFNCTERIRYEVASEFKCGFCSTFKRFVYVRGDISNCINDVTDAVYNVSGNSLDGIPAVREGIANIAKKAHFILLLSSAAQSRHGDAYLAIDPLFLDITRIPVHCAGARLWALSRR